MMHVVLKPFGWYPDGFTREALNIGDERDFGSAANGMMAEGMIGEKPAVVERVAAVDVVDVVDVVAPLDDIQPTADEQPAAAHRKRRR